MRTIAPLLVFIFLLAACDSPGGGSSGSNPTQVPLSFLTTTMPDGNYGVAYTGYIQSIGGIGPFVWRLDNGVLPPGITTVTTNTSTLDFVGTPTQSGTWFFTIELRDANNTVISAIFRITVDGPAYYGFPAGGTAVFIIDRSADTGIATSTGQTRLQRAQAMYPNIATSLSTSHNFDVLLVGGSNEVTSLFGSAVVADSTNLASAASTIQGLTPAGNCALYSALGDALHNYATDTFVVMLGGAAPGTDAGAPGGSTDREEIELAMQSWLPSLPNIDFECRQFGDNGEVGLLYQNIALQSGGSFYYLP